MVVQYLNLHHYGVVVNSVFWGLWLLPFGFAYLAQNFSGVLLPQYVDLVGNVTFPLELGEIAIVLWLIVMGAKDGPAPAV
jgi:hypothetical protein